jgi:hypothetical protein
VARAHSLKSEPIVSGDVLLRAEHIDKDICEECVAAAEAARMAEEEAITRKADKARLGAEKEARLRFLVAQLRDPFRRAVARLRAKKEAKEAQLLAKKAEEARLLAEKEAEEAQLVSEKEAEQAQLVAEKEAEQARFVAEKEAEGARLLAEKQVYFARQRAENEAYFARCRAEAQLRAEKETEEARLRAEQERDIIWAATLLARVILASRLFLHCLIIPYVRAKINSALKTMNVLTYFQYIWTDTKKKHWNFSHFVEKHPALLAEPPTKKQKTKGPNVVRITDFFRAG